MTLRPMARLHVFEGAGHRAINEEHAAFAALLRGWVAEQEAARAAGGARVGFVGLGNMGAAIVQASYMI